MSQENVEIVRRCFEAYRSGDTQPFAPGDSDFELVRSTKMPDGGGVFRGPAARAALHAWLGAFDQHEAMPTAFSDTGDRVVVTVLERGRPRGGTKMVQGTWEWVFTVRNGRIRRLEIFAERKEAIKAAGLSE
jgi:ketosteroid isomerase-like protein